MIGFCPFHYRSLVHSNFISLKACVTVTFNSPIMQHCQTIVIVIPLLILSIYTPPSSHRRQSQSMWLKSVISRSTGGDLFSFLYFYSVITQSVIHYTYMIKIRTVPENCRIQSRVHQLSATVSVHCSERRPGVVEWGAAAEVTFDIHTWRAESSVTSVNLLCKWWSNEESVRRKVWFVYTRA